MNMTNSKIKLLHYFYLFFFSFLWIMKELPKGAAPILLGMRIAVVTDILEILLTPVLVQLLRTTLGLFSHFPASESSSITFIDPSWKVALLHGTQNASPPWIFKSKTLKQKNIWKSKEFFFYSNKGNLVSQCIHTYS